MKFIVFVFLLYFVGAIAFLGSTQLISLMHYLGLGLSVLSFLQYCIKAKWTTVSFFIFCYAIVFPIYGSVKSSILFGQSFGMGVASLRYIWFIFFGFFLINIKYNYRTLLHQINAINVSIAVISIVLILVLNVHPSKIYQLQASTNVLGGISTGESAGVGGANIRGIRFAACSTFMIISLIYYQLSALRLGGRKNWGLFALLLVYYLFVQKGRQPIAVMSVVYIIYFLRMKGISGKKMAMIVMPFIVLFVLLMFDSNLLTRFTTILDGEDTKDFSTLARLWELEQITPFIYKNPILGVGNLSAHFGTGGFQTFFGRDFYLADIGVFGALARGGLLLVAIYVSIYISLWKASAQIKDSRCVEFMRYMIVVYVCLLILFFYDVMFASNCVSLAILFYPLFSRQPNNYIRQRATTASTRHQLI